MQLKLNLASRPFTNHRLFWVGIAILLVAGVWGGMWLKSEKEAAVRATAAFEKNLERTQDEFRRRKEEEERLRREEQNAALSLEEKRELAAARLIIYQKSFSMDRVLNELESYVPEDTRIVGIKVGGVNAHPDEKSAKVEVSAVGKTAAQLTEMMSRFEKSPGPFLIDQANQGQPTDTGEIPFAITLTFKPKEQGQ
jgi:hypothetical protein